MIVLEIKKSASSSIQGKFYYLYYNKTGQKIKEKG